MHVYQRATTRRTATVLTTLLAAGALAVGGASAASAHVSSSTAPASGTPSAAAAATGSAGGLQAVTYQGYRLQVPAAWPVVDLSKNPNTCVRFDVHAVYLGHPTAAGQASCPSDLVGRTGAVLVEPLDGTGDAVVGPHTVVAPNGTAAYRPTGTTAASSPSASSTTTSSTGEIDFAVPSASVLVTATFSAAPAERSEAQTILASGRLLPGAHALASLPRADAGTTIRPAAASGPQPGSYTGEGFDACTAPSTSQMSAWLSGSPYRAIGVYIGGIDRACAQPNLTASWVSTETAAGWHLFPLYVGSQAPCSGIGTVMSSDPSTAYSTGVSEADDAVAQAQAVGLPGSSVVYNDMEAYDNTNSSCSTAVLNYISGWTAELHARGYLSGEYSSAGSGITDLVDQVGSGTYTLPDQIDFAWWNGVADTNGGSYIPAGYWSEHQRIHQYHGGANETYDGVTINIDGNYLDVGTGSVPPPPPPPTAKYWVDTFANAPVYASPTSTVQTGTLYAGTNYVYCKVWGPMVGSSTVYNHWWLLTDPDVGPADHQYVSAYYLSKWGNDQALDDNGDPIPDC